MMESQFDKELVDRTEAEFINFMVTKGVINSKRISTADIETIRELLERNEEEIVNFYESKTKGVPFELSPEKEEKLKVLLGGENDQDPERIRETLEMAETAIDILKERSGFPITGGVVYGSRINPAKSPHSKSDIDITVYVNSRDLLIGTETQLDRWGKIIDELNLPVQININQAFDRRGLLDHINSPSSIILPRWAYAPNAVRFVGQMFVGSEVLVDEEATNYIRSKLGTEEWREAVREQISQIEGRIGSLLYGQSQLPLDKIEK